MDTRRERFLKDLQQRLDAVPLRTTHVHDDCEAMSGHLLTAKTRIKRSDPIIESRSANVLVLDDCIMPTSIPV